MSDKDRKAGPQKPPTNGRTAARDWMPLTKRPGYLIRRLNQVHSSLFFEECRHFNITPIQYGVLTVLYYSPGSDQISVSTELGIDRTNAADVLKRLAARGLIRRERSKRDRRSVVCSLTDEGLTVMTEMYDRMKHSQERLLAPLLPEFRPAFLAMIEQIIEGNSQYGQFLLQSDKDFDSLRRNTSGSNGTDEGD